MWELVTIKRTWAKAVLADAEKEKQEGIQGKWQMESLFKEVRELFKKSCDLSCNAHMRKKGEISEWTSKKV